MQSSHPLLQFNTYVVLIKKLKLSFSLGIVPLIAPQAFVFNRTSSAMLVGCWNSFFYISVQNSKWIPAKLSGRNKFKSTSPVIYSVEDRMKYISAYMITNLLHIFPKYMSGIHNDALIYFFTSLVKSDVLSGKSYEFPSFNNNYRLPCFFLNDWFCGLFFLRMLNEESPLFAQCSLRIVASHMNDMKYILIHTYDMLPTRAVLWDARLRLTINESTWLFWQQVHFDRNRVKFTTFSHQQDGLNLCELL